MGASQVILTILRVLVVVIALGVVGAGIWARHIIHDMAARGSTVLDAAGFESKDEDSAWRSFMQTAIYSQIRLWIAMAAGCFSALATLLVVLSSNIQRLRLPSPFLLPLELLSSLSLAAAFGASLSLTLKFPSTLPNPHSSGDLASFTMLLPLSKGYAMAAGAGMFFSLTTTISFLIHTIHRVRDSKACSFEPTASGMGMSHDYRMPSVDGLQSGDEEKGLVGAGADMGRRESMQSRKGKEEDGQAWPLGAPTAPPAAAQKLEPVPKHHRPHRPWSEMPK